MRIICLLTGLMACTSEKSGIDETDPNSETAELQDNETGESTESGDSDNEVELPEELTGTPPETALPVPSFTAMNSDDTTRDQNDLQGMATVIWFFPLAGTSG